MCRASFVLCVWATAFCCGSSAVVVLAETPKGGPAPAPGPEPPAGYVTCGGMPNGYGNTACPVETATCCHYHDQWGCAVGKDAVCCGTGGQNQSNYTACPTGYTCTGANKNVFGVTTCVSPNGNTTGKSVCKPGAVQPFSKTKKNVLVIGDSLSLGYVHLLAAAVSDIALVQHSPQGNADEAAYGNQCLDVFLRAANGTPLRPDLLYFNWGMHSRFGPNDTVIPGQHEPFGATYAKYLEMIAAKLVAWAQPTQAGAPAVKLLFAISTPYMDNSTINSRMMVNNKLASAIMQKHAIPTVNLYDPIVAKCGQPPQESCFGHRGCWSPHCPPGYGWLVNSTIAPAVRSTLL